MFAISDKEFMCVLLIKHQSLLYQIASQVQLSNLKCLLDYFCFQVCNQDVYFFHWAAVVTVGTSVSLRFAVRLTGG